VKLRMQASCGMGSAAVKKQSEPPVASIFRKPRKRRGKGDRSSDLAIFSRHISFSAGILGKGGTKGPALDYHLSFPGHYKQERNGGHLEAPTLLR